MGCSPIRSTTTLHRAQQQPQNRLGIANDAASGLASEGAGTGGQGARPIGASRLFYSRPTAPQNIQSAAPSGSSPIAGSAAGTFCAPSDVALAAATHALCRFGRADAGRR